MSRKASLLLFSFVVASSSAFGQEWASKMFKTKEHDFGTVARGAKAEFDFPISNLYLKDVHIASAYSSCGCTSVEIVKSTLKTYEEGAIHARFNTPTFLGSRSATLTVVIDKPMAATVQLHIRGVIRSDVTFEPSSVQLGDVEPGTPVERKVKVNYFGWSNWGITDVKSSNPNITAKVLSTKKLNGSTVCELAVSLDKNATAGYLQDNLMLVTTEGSTQMPLAVEGRIVSPLTVSPSSLFMGVVQPGQEVTKSLVVKGAKPFRVLSIACDDKAFKFDTSKDDTAKTVHVIPVTFVAGTSAGKVTQSIKIVTDLGSAAPELSAYAVISSQTAANEK